MEWPSVLRCRLQCAPSPVQTSVTGGISLRASHGVWRELPLSPDPGMAETYGCPSRFHIQFYEEGNSDTLKDTNKGAAKVPICFSFGGGKLKQLIITTIHQVIGASAIT
ncbi:Uncharacterized protein FWK35_00035787, partial [Aphis craccivora]